MATAAQLEANTANAQLSTGPRTEEGKAKSAANSTQHGFYSKTAVLLSADDHRAFAELRSAYLDQIRPANCIQCTLFDQLVLAAWNLTRANRLEADLAKDGTDPLISETHAPTLSRIATFRQRAERTFHKCLKQLRELQGPRPKPKPIERNEPKFDRYVGIRTTPKVGRNEPCPCQSGRKYKQCCLQNPALNAA